MIWIKNRPLSIVSAVLALAAQPATAAVEFYLNSTKTYRQNQSEIAFRRGAFDVELEDGQAVYEDGCVTDRYVPPGLFLRCAGGTTGYVVSGTIDDKFPPESQYYYITSILQATAIEPRQPDLIQLVAAPASALPRPEGGFKDSSFSVYYNLQENFQREYVITRYSNTRKYSKSQRGEFEEEIVPGVYKYSFPRLGNPNISVGVQAQIIPNVEGVATVNNKTFGFEFTNVSNKFTERGFLNLNVATPNIISWRGVLPAYIIPQSDKLYISIRVLKNHRNPNSATDLIDDDTGRDQSIFPSFSTQADARVLLDNPLTTQFFLPLSVSGILPGGTKGVLELELERQLQLDDAGVLYDFSTRKFQIPVHFINEYSDYQGAQFKSGRKKISVLDDADGDGFNNLNEWILDSSASDRGSIPKAPIPEGIPAFENEAKYYGFSVEEKLETVPDVHYILERSFDKGLTWSTFVSDANWTVTRTRTRIGKPKEIDPPRVVIKVASKSGDFPLGTEQDIYRVKIVLAP